MPEVVLTGAAGRIEGRYTQGKSPTAPIALILHPHPKAGGQMNHPVAVQLFHLFMKRGFSVLRFNFRGVGRSQGEFDSGIIEREAPGHLGGISVAESLPVGDLSD